MMKKSEGQMNRLGKIPKGEKQTVRRWGPYQDVRRR
jgi:hypothetical protein